MSRMSRVSCASGVRRKAGAPMHSDGVRRKDPSYVSSYHNDWHLITYNLSPQISTLNTPIVRTQRGMHKWAGTEIGLISRASWLERARACRASVPLAQMIISLYIKNSFRALGKRNGGKRYSMRSMLVGSWAPSETCCAERSRSIYSEEDASWSATI